jgi:hypothetical protein
MRLLGADGTSSLCRHDHWHLGGCDASLGDEGLRMELREWLTAPRAGSGACGEQQARPATL